MEKLKLDKHSLKKFGEKSAIGFFVLGLLFFLLKKKVYFYFWIAAAIFGLMSMFMPKALKVVCILSMRIAEPIGWVMSRVIFSIFFFLVITPIGLVLKLLGKDLLNIKFNRQAKSYWIIKEKKQNAKEQFERQF